MSFDPIDNGWRKLLKDGRIAKNVMEYKEFIPETQLTPYTDGSTTEQTVIPTSATMDDGTVYRVKTASGTYLATGKAVTLEGVIEPVLVGNGVGFGLEDTGENYGCLSGLVDGEPMFFAADYTNGTIFSMDVRTETIIPIDPKYLPNMGGDGLTVIELETVLADENTTMLSETDIANLSAAMEAQMPVVIRFEVDISGVKTRFVLMFDCFTIDGGAQSFYAKVQTREFMFANMMGTWMGVVQTVS